MADVPTYPQEGSQGSVMAFYEDMTRVLQNSDELQQAQGEDVDLDYLRQLQISRMSEVEEPTPMRPFEGELSYAQRVAAQQHELRRMRSVGNAINEVRRLRAESRDFMLRNPEVAKEAGVTEEWLESVKNVGLKAAKKGWTVLDVLLRNFDRPRSAIATYNLALQHGGSGQDARNKALAALNGSSKGWVWVPESMGPSFREVLQAAGYDDDLSTAAMGFAMDVLVDPINLLGVGASRKGIEIGAHQILNKLGRQVHGVTLRKHVDAAVRAAGVANELDLGIDELRAAYTSAATEMREMINASPKVARQYLDMGGLKIAGYTLPGTAFVRKREAIRGGLEYDYVSQNLISLLGEGSMSGMDRIGRRLRKEGKTPLARRVGRFAESIPANLREAGKLIGIHFNRTSPAAGKEYGWFKQAEFYERLGYSESRALEKVRQTFDGVHNSDLNELPFVIERGEEAVGQYLNQLAMSKGQAYAGLVSESLRQFRMLMDEVSIDEVRRGWMLESLQKRPQMIDMFEAWVRSGRKVQVNDPRVMKSFNDAYIAGYIPHIYHNTAKARKLATPMTRPGPPTIFEPFTKRRVVKTLEEAQDQGLTPETNLAAIAMHRLSAHAKAATTSEFLQEAVDKFGATRSGQVGTAQRAVQLAGTPTPRPLYDEILKMRTNSFGKVPLSIQQQKEVARQLAYAGNVPIEAIGKLDEAAISEFLKHRLRTVTVRIGERAWDKYVVRATQRGLYDGFALAPADNVYDAIARARELVDPAYPHWAPIKAGGLAIPDKLQEMLFPAPIAEDIERMAMRMPEEVRRLLRGYDMVNFWWKRNVTIIWPAFHSRNKITNLLNSSLDIGISGVLDRQTMHDVIRGNKGVLKLPGGVKLSYDQVRELAHRHGVVRAVYRRADISEMVADVVKGETKVGMQLARKLGVKLPGGAKRVGPKQISAPTRLRALQKAGEEVGLLVENADRMQLFVKSLQRGMSPEQAGRRVNEFLFDYDDISRFERQWVRRFFNPFWTWTRKNLALQAKTAVRQPGRFVAPAKFFRAFSSDEKDAIAEDVERRLLPEHFGEIFSLRLESRGPISSWIVNFDHPEEDLNRLWRGSAARTTRDWTASVGPFMTDILETAMDYDFYRGQKRVEYLRGQRVYDIMEKFRETPIGTFLKMRKETYRDETKITVDPARWRWLMRMTAWQFSRFYTTVGRMTDPATGNIHHRLFNFLTGMRVEHVNPGEELRRMADAALFAKDEGMLQRLRVGLREAYDLERLEMLDAQEAEQQLRQSEAAVNTPIYEAELPYQDTWTYDAAEE